MSFKPWEPLPDPQWTPADRQRLQLDALERWFALPPSVKHAKLNALRMRLGLPTSELPEREARRCEKCGHRWMPRCDAPKRCPECQSRG
jgi:hypothetical protein